MEFSELRVPIICEPGMGEGDRRFADGERISVWCGGL